MNEIYSVLQYHFTNFLNPLVLEAQEVLVGGEKLYYIEQCNLAVYTEYVQAFTKSTDKTEQ